MCGIADPAFVLGMFYLSLSNGRIEPWQGLYRLIFSFLQIFSCGKTASCATASPCWHPIWSSLS